MFRDSPHANLVTGTHSGPRTQWESSSQQGWNNSVEFHLSTRPSSACVAKLAQGLKLGSTDSSTALGAMGNSINLHWACQMKNCRWNLQWQNESLQVRENKRTHGRVSVAKKAASACSQQLLASLSPPYISRRWKYFLGSRLVRICNVCLSKRAQTQNTCRRRSQLVGLGNLGEWGETSKVARWSEGSEWRMHWKAPPFFSIVSPTKGSVSHSGHKAMR